MDKAEFIDAEVVSAIEETIRRNVSQFGLKSVTIQPGEDLEGEPALRVTIDYEKSDSPVDPAIVARLLFKVQDALRAKGETRFAFLKHNFSEDQKVLKAGHARRRIAANG